MKREWKDVVNVPDLQHGHLRSDFRYIALLVLGCLVQPVLHAQQGNVITYGTDQGLARPDVACIYQDARGTLWIGTPAAGLYRFNQGRFHQEVLLPDETGYQIKKIGEDSEGNLLILSEQGLLRYDGLQITTVGGVGILDFIQTDRGLYWITADQVCLHTPSGAYCKEEHGLALAPGRDDNGICIITANGIICLNADLTGEDREQLPLAPHFWYCGADQDGELWFNDGAGILRHENNLLPTYRIDPIHINTVISGALGSKLLGGEDGVYVFQPADSSLISLQVSANVQCLYFDRQDRLWIGTEGQGLLRYFGAQHRFWSLPRHVSRISGGMSAQTSLCITDKGDAFFLGSPGFKIALPDSESHGQVYVDDQYRLWALTDQGIWLSCDTGWLSLDTMITSEGGQNQIISSDGTGNLWMRNAGTLMRFGPRPVTFPPGIAFSANQVEGVLPEDDVIAMLADTAFRTWRIGSHSIGNISNDTYRDIVAPGFTITSAAKGENRTIWLGTRAAGVYRMRMDSTAEPEPLQTSYPLRAYDILFLKESESHLIVGTDRNVLQLNLDSTGSIVTAVDVISENAGIVLKDMHPQDYAMTGDGHLLILNNDRITELALSTMSGVSHAPDVFVSEVAINGVNIYQTHIGNTLGPFYQQASPVFLRPGENRVSFTLDGNSVESETLQYQWRLIGNTSLWSALSTNREIRLSGLSPGNYRFEARVCDPAGNCSLLANPWKFTIRKAIWQHWWFRPGVFIVLIMGIWSLITGRRRRKSHTASLEKQRLEAELNAMTQEQKALQLQMNPHFIFNALQTIRSQIQEDNLPTARDNLTRFAKLMRATLDSSRAEKISLEEELEFLQAYIDVETIGSTLPVHYSVQLDEGVEPFALEIPPMLIQPILENAVKYGGDGDMITVQVQIALKDGVLIVEIADNGPGFGPGQSGHQSASLQIIRSRLQKMEKAGNLEVLSQPERGTRMILRIPV